MQKSRKRHTEKEIEKKLARGELMASQGKTQSEIAKSLGITVMTYSRWRKMAGTRADAPKTKSNGSGQQAPQNRLHSLELENARLRDVIVQMLLDQDKYGRQLA